MKRVTVRMLTIALTLGGATVAHGQSLEALIARLEQVERENAALRKDVRRIEASARRERAEHQKAVLSERVRSVQSASKQRPDSNSQPKAARSSAEMSFANIAAKSSPAASEWGPASSGWGGAYLGATLGGGRTRSSSKSNSTSNLTGIIT